MLPIELLEYEDGYGRCPFGRWFAKLDGQTAQRVTFALEKLAKGNTSNVKGVGGGVSEVKMDFGPGYRIYFGRDGDRLVILLTGGTKKRQQNDIAKAIELWADYKQQRRTGR